MIIEQLQQQTGLTFSQIHRFEETASKRYKIYEIPKRNGGLRTIAHPSRSLKSMQRWISKRVFRYFPIHSCATAYKKGASIVQNATAHKDTRYTLRMDFHNFFPSFSDLEIKNFIITKNIEYNMDLTDKDINFIVNITCRYGCLTIGAPSSPIVTNTLMYVFDDEVSRYCRERGVVYTRYADDMFFSTNQPNVLLELPVVIKEAAKSFSFADLKVNEDKTVFLRLDIDVPIENKKVIDNVRLRKAILTPHDTKKSETSGAAA